MSDTPDVQAAAYVASCSGFIWLHRFPFVNNDDLRCGLNGAIQQKMPHFAAPFTPWFTHTFALTAAAI
jgi:hypothetical protein